MKTRTILLATFMILGISVASVQAKASYEPPVVKLLPLSTNGMLRLLVTNPDHGVVKINFYQGEVTLTNDRVYPKEYEKGFLKSYDLSHLKPGSYTIEVVTAGITTSYELLLKSDKKVWARYWDNFLGAEQMVALN